jgi:flagellar hook protein FlgE
MAINGDGFFVVAQPSSVSDNKPVLSGADLYTRRGDFQENQKWVPREWGRKLSDGHPTRSDDRQSRR